ncbi:type III-B CRISPR module-associated protein Cmr3 [Fervidobacterium riparium]|uniref:CRISPR-associated protein Cmr3 n=1 Tax=Fervidobacterium gondwanense DSM 13020 TaxID=1121883 RepID=A0A1M7TGD5_FERGO|nr:type III-B CRISPR module-associated protein Cmr3 [Fervidobacterium gondwanense]UXF00258.1 hypothetical protein IB67_01285 [Fervidobacterium riparium]SHN69804.1 CRISPR-associated protein Cmr3 [Fervidobacterium gondwanense DSM 13020]
MKLYAIYFEPEDWLAFREIRRFGAGSAAKSTFPSPLTFYGAIRTALMKLYGIQLSYHKKPDLGKYQELLGDDNSPGKIKLFGPFIYSEESGKRKHYFPAPKNVYVKSKKYKVMKLLEYETRVGEHIFKGLPWIPEVKDVDAPDKSFIELNELEKLQHNEEFQLENPENYVVETKLGIALDDDKKTKEGMLYALSIYRFKNGGFFMLTDSEETKNEIEKLDGVFLGAKQRWARVFVEELETTVFDEPNFENIAAMLITPAIYDGGIVPKDLKFGNAEILTVAGGRKMGISGWDYMNGRPKTLHHAVSPGTVYYLSHKPSLRDSVSNKSKLNLFGFGKCIYIPYETKKI